MLEARSGSLGRSMLARLAAPGGTKAALCATGRARTAADTNAVHDRLLQSMRVRFSDSEQWSSPVKPPRSQNYVQPHDARTRVHVAKVVARPTKSPGPGAGASCSLACEATGGPSEQRGSGADLHRRRNNAGAARGVPMS